MKGYSALAALALAMAMAACGTNDPVPPDDTPPARVTDLAIKSVTMNVVTLRWTTPGDNGNQGTAATYQVRWSPGVINEGNFAAATPIPDPPVPGTPGSVEIFAVPNMDISRSLHFALRTLDEGGLASPVSNDAYFAPDGFPVEFYKDLPAARDNTIYSEDDSLSNGSGEFFFAGRNSSGDRRRALVAFAIADSIPPGAVIDSVIMTLHMSDSGTGTDTVSVHTLTADWGEASSNAPGGEESGVQAQPNDATWGYRLFDTAAWTTAGGDFAGTASAKLAVRDPGYYVWTSRQMMRDVQAWLDTPAGNAGWVLRSDESGPISLKRFDSREHATPGYQPRLRVYYSTIH